MKRSKPLSVQSIFLYYDHLFIPLDSSKKNKKKNVCEFSLRAAHLQSIATESLSTQPLKRGFNTVAVKYNPYVYKKKNK